MAATLNARLDVRLPNQLKDIIQQAAELNGQSVSDFVVSTLSETARRIVQRDATARAGKHDGPGASDQA